LHNQLILLSLNLRLLLFDDLYKQLVFKTVGCDGEIDETNLNTNFWQVMWVTKFRGHEELEVGAHGYQLFSKLYAVLALELHDVLLEKRF